MTSSAAIGSTSTSTRAIAASIACGYAVFTEAGRQANGNYVTCAAQGPTKPIVITFNQLVGTDAGNYTGYPHRRHWRRGHRDPSRRSRSLAFAHVSKVYDGNTDATVALNNGATGVYSGDTLSSTQTAIYTGSSAKDVGTAKPITVSGMVWGGAHAGNYAVSNTTATGTVTAKPITVSGISATDGPYDGTKPMWWW